MVTHPNVIYPHYVFIASQTEYETDADGIVTVKEPQWQYLCRGRYEQNGKGTKVVYSGGRTDVYSGIVYTRPLNVCIAIGTKIKVATSATPTENDIIFVGQMDKPDCSRLNCKFYVNS